MQALGWSAMTSLEQGLALYYDWFRANQGKLRETVVEGAFDK
jgi:nucleoside-diphosphate-sugar epimerase